MLSEFQHVSTKRLDEMNGGDLWINGNGDIYMILKDYPANSPGEVLTVRMRPADGHIESLGGGNEVMTTNGLLAPLPA